MSQITLVYTVACMTGEARLFPCGFPSKCASATKRHKPRHSPKLRLKQTGSHRQEMAKATSQLKAWEDQSHSWLRRQLLELSITLYLCMYIYIYICCTKHWANTGQTHQTRLRGTMCVYIYIIHVVVGAGWGPRPPVAMERKAGIFEESPLKQELQGQRMAPSLGIQLQQIHPVGQSLCLQAISKLGPPVERLE